ncbi:hypothetical protein PTSG_12946 [Salpingoeca rosetta]|uniref:Carboxypeptidase n=1 Tax=Salpingoeca rosetta (strain ATCC 50818 / BSB-021) TaxID=946362 RepID=F2UNE1_SALR5|nr:uncharacterized protein PTSG_12946 [Salpingoeca rosetta]EGD79146.1 hypothetical protein PTSG_12946 [Salpingoeca rosetta]|eukprot:XP_004989231.1 hypothetical protein PTSG_12946 [Salpingoeca rosetta]
MRFVLATALVLALVAATCNAAITKDQVTSLPGWDKALPSKHYSGYLPVGNGKGFLHYWFIESEKNPSTAPVVVWLNGGPGSSSLVGLLTENGQFQTNDNSLDEHGNITLLYNPYSWSTIANMLYVEQPKGVGFSYCAEGVDCVNTDESVGEEFADFLDGFFNGFSEYKKNDFYITGESYAGIYIPEILKAVDARGNLNLKGAAIGDGCIGNEVSTCGFQNQADRIAVEFYYGHGMYPQTLYPKIKDACGNFTKETQQCRAALSEMNRKIGNFDIYNVYDQCGSDQVTVSDIYRQLREAREFTTTGSQAFAVHPQLQKGVAGALNDYACGAEKVMGMWLSKPDVQKALHVDHQGRQQYRRTAADLRPLYKTLAQKYRILIYSGSVDACVPYWGSEEWTRELGFPEKEAWRPWTSPSSDEPNQEIQAGYVTTYNAGQHNFTFLTVSGAGHLVPQHKPAQALTMFKRFLNNQPF